MPPSQDMVNFLMAYSGFSLYLTFTRPFAWDYFGENPYKAMLSYNIDR